MHDRPTSSFSRSAFPATLFTHSARALLLMAAVHASGAGAQDAQDAQDASDEPEADAPSRIVGMLSAGVPLRLTLDEALDQSRVAPAFGNVLLGYELPGGRLRHGFGVGLSWNMSHEGGYTTPVYAGDQLALMPAYLAYYKLNPDVFGIGHVGIPILVRGGSSAGLELGAMIAYRVTAGAGVFAGLDLDAYNALGFNLLASLELGVVIDYEVLP
jgi:hypothetical protein